VKALVAIAVSIGLLLSCVVTAASAHAFFDWTVHRLAIGEIRLFRNEGAQDYHTGQQPIIGSISIGQPVLVNGLVKNLNHTGEHFDYVTQVYNREGIVEYIYVRHNVAVPFQGQTPIDSSAPLVLNNTGLYLVKVFAVIGMNDRPQLASEPKVDAIEVSVKDNIVIPTARISQQQAIEIVEKDLARNLDDYNGITGIIDRNGSRYVPIQEFLFYNLELPLVYVHPNNSLLYVAETGYENRGTCNSGLLAYCGYFSKYNFDYGSRLVYGLEMQIDSNEEVLVMYMVDATTGRIVDSTFLRSGWIRSHGG
jgi:hypothetical protein